MHFCCCSTDFVLIFNGLSFCFCLSLGSSLANASAFWSIMVIAISLSLKRIYVGGIYYKEYKNQKAGVVQPITSMEEEDMNKKEEIELNQGIAANSSHGVGGVEGSVLPDSPHKRDRDW